MQGWHAKKYANNVRIMHQSNNIGKAPSLHLLHTARGVFLKRTTSFSNLYLAVHGCSLIFRPLPFPMWPGNEASMTLLVSIILYGTSSTTLVSWSRLQTYGSVVEVHGSSLIPRPLSFSHMPAQERG